MLNEQKKIFFPKSKEDNIYRSYALCKRDCFPFFFFFFEKQLIENKSYFSKSFLLTKDSFPLTIFFFMLPNTEKCGKLSL